jgi:hypothetical protein
LPLGDQLADLIGEPLDPLNLFMDCMDILLKHDLLGTMGHLNVRDPIPKGLTPASLTAVAVTMSEQKGQKVLPGNPQCLGRIFTASGQITHRFIFFCGNINRG